MGLFDIFRRNDQDDVAKEIEQLKQRRKETETGIDNNSVANEVGELIVEDVFSITGRGTVVTGRVTEGFFRVGDKVMVCRSDQDNVQTTITGIEAFRKHLDSAHKGDQIGMLLKSVARNDISSRDIIRRVN